MLNQWGSGLVGNVLNFVRTFLIGLNCFPVSWSILLCCLPWGVGCCKQPYMNAVCCSCSYNKQGSIVPESAYIHTARHPQQFFPTPPSLHSTEYWYFIQRKRLKKDHIKKVASSGADIRSNMWDNTWKVPTFRGTIPRKGSMVENRRKCCKISEFLCYHFTSIIPRKVSTFLVTIHGKWALSGHHTL